MIHGLHVILLLCFLLALFIGLFLMARDYRESDARELDAERKRTQDLCSEYRNAYQRGYADGIFAARREGMTIKTPREMGIGGTHNDDFSV
jgi:hypothetical protein